MSSPVEDLGGLVEQPPAVPVIVLGGYLGAGKTTLLNRILREQHRRRIAVIVNDFGAVAIDAQLIVDHDGQTISLANGCVCCTLVDGLGAALEQLRAVTPPLDLVVIEASGVADPAAIAAYGTLPGFRLDRTVVLADATTIERRLADRLVGPTVLRQLMGASMVVVTNADRADAPTLAHAVSSIAAAGGVPALVGDSRSLPLDALLHGSTATVQSPPVELTLRLDPHAQFVLLDTQLHHELSLTRARAINRMAMHEFLRCLPDQVVRVKGVVRLQGSDTLWAVQRTGSQTTWEQLSAPARESVSRLVVIWVGEGINPRSIDTQFAALC